MRRLSTACGIGAIALLLGVAQPAAAQRRAEATDAQPAVAVPKTAAAPAPAAKPAPPAAAPAAPPRSAGGGSGSTRGQDRSPARDGADERSKAGNDGGSTVPGRRQGTVPKTGDAAARTSPPPPPHDGGGSNGGVIVGAYPWWSSASYGGSYVYDPGFGWYPAYDTGGAASSSEGALRLKVKPVEASVFVDGYYAGIVDDFDGVFQRLRLDAGPHHVEMRAAGYDDLPIDVLIQADHTTTYQGALVKNAE